MPNIPALVFCLLLPARVLGTSYQLVNEYVGPTFFNDWTFYDHYDNLTNGDVVFVSASEAASSQLAYVDTQTNHAIIKVDNTSTVPWNQKRNAVRITSQALYPVGSVWIADLYHVPYGCSVWPAWWSQAPGWPAGGEIDTFEGINLMTLNQMSLHTLPGCKIASPTETSTLVNSTDCSYVANSNQGCIVTDPNPASYGAAFAQAGGGVFVTELAETGVSIWFYPRASIPSAITSNSSTLDTAALGVPVGNWPSTQCNINQYFAPQSLIFDITLCGDFAGNPNLFAQMCSGNCYNDYVVGNGSNYATAYFEIGAVKVYSSNTSAIQNGTTTTSAAGSSRTNEASPSLLANVLTLLSSVVLVSLVLL
ncbi:hypothetical protein APHAL10511_002658 [Amanita phalloides]|nr:hypothetical protein APHAL10511_002658 [Amanita phalloides]